MRYLIHLWCLLALVSCYSEPDFPVEPYIEFKGVSFVDAPNTPNQDGFIPKDTLKVVISFQDGDGDLSQPGENIEPYQAIFNNRYIRIGEFDTLPEHNCTNYLSGYFDENEQFVQSTANELVTDTIYIKPNPLTHNFFLDFYTIEDGVEKFFDVVEISYPLCGESPNGRFDLKLPPNERKPISGLITYKFTSYGLIPYFTGERLKVKVRIADRAGHISNRVESPDFTLQEIQQ